MMTESIPITNQLKGRLQSGCQRLGCRGYLIILLVIWALLVQGIMLFQEPETRTVAVSAFVCGLTTLVVGGGVHVLRRYVKPPQLHGCLAGLLVALLFG